MDDSILHTQKMKLCLLRSVDTELYSKTDIAKMQARVKMFHDINNRN